MHYSNLQCSFPHGLPLLRTSKDDRDDHRRKKNSPQTHESFMNVENHFSLIKQLLHKKLMEVTSAGSHYMY